MTSSAPNKKVCLTSLGCPKNLVDAEMMLGFLKKDGFSFTADPQEAQVLVVNTCGFVEESKKESIDKILEMAAYKETGACEVLVATGCLTQRYSSDLAREMPEVDAFVGLGEFDKLASILREKLAHTNAERVWVKGGGGPAEFSTSRQILPDPDLPRLRATPKHFTYVKISEGCSHRCSFCVIPHIRGDLKSRTLDSIVREVREMVGEGVKEFNLIAQDLNEYGKDLRNGTQLAELISALNAIPGEFWLRPLYMYPLEFGDRLIGTLADAERVVRYVDMPLQHINDRILRSMKRGSPSRYVRQVLSKLKTAMPDLTLRTTFIVGYPGETDAEFAELCDFVRETEFDRLGAFRYSPEESTSAATLPDLVPDEVKDERFATLMEIQQAISLKKNQSLVGKTFRLLAEGPCEESDWVLQARLPSQAPEIDGVTYISEGSPRPGEFFSATIVEAHEYDLVATPIA